jgi:hypothetical protein
MAMADMHMEFLRNDAPDCPLIRLYEFNLSEAQFLRRMALQLASGRTPRPFSTKSKEFMR